MSRYEQVCDMLRERRRAMKPGAVDREMIQVIADAMMELGPLFADDARACERLYDGGFQRGGGFEPGRLLINREESAWPLQSWLDA